MMLCVNCGTQPGYPHARQCLRPKFYGEADGGGPGAPHAATGLESTPGDVLGADLRRPAAVSEVPNAGGAGAEAPAQGSEATPSLDTYGDNSTAAQGEPVETTKNDR